MYTLDNNTWVTDTGGTDSTMTFTPNVEQTGGSSTYSIRHTVTSGNSIALVNRQDRKWIFISLGWWTLDIAADQANGDYTGTFTVTVTY